jgi:exodeoxyribonuclease V alpha subunit
MVHQPRVGQMGVSLGSKLLWLKNDYSKAPFRDAEGDPVLDAATGEPVCAGFMNGALVVVRRHTERGAWVEFDDGAADEIRLSDLVNLTRGWAISVHKAQGSAFRKVVVPFAASRILDRALIYTAVTRAVETVVLVGDPAVLRSAVEAEPKALARRHTLCFDRALVHG